MDKSADSLDDLISTLDELEPLVAEVARRGGTGGMACRLAYSQVVRLNHTLHAVRLLVPDGHAAEIMALARVPTEAAIHLRWFGKDEGRFQQFMDHAILDAAKVSEAWEKHGAPHSPELARAADEVQQRRRTRNARKLGFPDCAAMETQIWGQTVVYDLLIRRASNDAHATFHAAMRALQKREPADLTRAVHFVVSGGSLLLEAAIAILDWPEYLPRLRQVTGWLKVDWTA